VEPPLYRVTIASDIRGSLAAIEFDQLPFRPQRFFTVYDVPSKDVRGMHAHRSCEQFLVALAGSVTCLVDDGSRRQTYLLDDPGVGLYMPALTWGTQYGYAPGTILVVFASHPYDPDDYLRDYDEFVRQVNAPRGFLIHQGLLNQRGEDLIASRVPQLSRTALQPLVVGQPWQV